MEWYLKQITILCKFVLIFISKKVNLRKGKRVMFHALPDLMKARLSEYSFRIALFLFDMNVFTT